MVRLFCVIFFIINTNAGYSDISNNLLNSILNKYKHTNQPLIVLVDTKNKRIPNLKPWIDSDDYESSEEYKNEFKKDWYKRTHKNSAYLLHRLLRSGDGNDSLETAKNALRSALRARCMQVNICVKECPKKKPLCPVKCKNRLDRQDLCGPLQPSKDCRKPKCGRTMPPSWRLG